MTSWTRGLAATFTVLALLLPHPGHTSPPGPMTLWELTERSRLIVLARTVRTYDAEPAPVPRLPGETEEAHLKRRRWADMEPRCRTEVEVLETWKGSPGGERVTIHPWDGRDCYGPDSFPPGRLVAVFLHRGEAGGWEVTGLSYGARPLREEWAKFIRARVKEAVAIQARPPVHPRQRLWWNVRAASHQFTRWDGIEPLFGDSLLVKDRNATRVPPRPHPLTREAQESIAAGFISDPRIARELPLVLMALAGHPSAEVDRAASVLLEALLEAGDEDAAQNAMDLLQVRLGVTGPGTERCWVPPWGTYPSAEELEQERTCVRARWERIRALEAKKPRSSAFSAPAWPRGAGAP